MVDKEIMEIAIPLLTKVRDRFIQIWKRMGPMVYLETARQTLPITRGVKEKPQPQEKGSLPEEKGKDVDTSSPIVEVLLKNSKGKGNSISLPESKV